MDIVNEPSDKDKDAPVANAESCIPQKTIAHAWRQAGWDVFPCFEADTWARSKLHLRKSPDTARGFYDATQNEAVIDAFWDAFPNRLVGIRIPARVNVADIDLKIDPPKDGFESLDKAGLECPPTYCTKTPSGGMHYYYKKDASLNVKATVDLKLADGRILDGVDRRTEGSYTIAYSENAPFIEDLTEAPEWLNQESPQLGLNPYSGGLTKWLSELPEGDPDRRVSVAIKRFPAQDFGHADMLRMQTELVRLGAESHTGVGEALEMLQALWLFGEYDTLHYQSEWNAALEGAVRKFGSPIEPQPLELVGVGSSDMQPSLTPLSDNHDSAAMEWVATVLDGDYCWSKYTGWLGYEDGVWSPQTVESIIESVRKIIHKRWDEARRKPELSPAPEVLKKFLSKTRLAGIESLLRGHLEVQPEVLDGHVELLCAKNGVVALKTGELMPHDPSYFFTKQTICNYQPNAKHPDWTKALGAIPNYAEHYIQTFLGQGLTGYILAEDVALVLGGGGRNGKSTICDLAVKVLGSFAVLASPGLLTGKDSDHTTELTDLVGKRLALLEEFPRMGTLNTSRLKRVVGTPEISARRMRQDNQTWDASHTLLITTNHEIQIPSGDDGTWRRLVKINFPYRYVERPLLSNDRPAELGLRDRLMEGAEGQHEAVLAWLVKGAMTWFENGRKLPILPTEVLADIAEWRESQDSLGSFLKSNLELEPTSWVALSDLFIVFKKEFGDEELRSDRDFALGLKSHEFVVSHGLRVESRQRTHSKYISRPTRAEYAMHLSDLPKQANLIQGLRFKE